MTTFNTKLYVQLQPDDAGLTLLRLIQGSLEPAKVTRLVHVAALHVTVIHIGLVSRMIDSITVQSAMTASEILLRVNELNSQLQAAIEHCQFEKARLQPTGYARFGSHQTTYVATFASTPELDQLHNECLQVLQRFFRSCGIQNVEEFMAHDYNFQNALTLRPHVTIAKSYDGEDCAMALKPMTFHIMPVEYNT